MYALFQRQSDRWLLVGKSATTLTAPAGDAYTVATVAEPLAPYLDGHWQPTDSGVATVTTPAGLAAFRGALLARLAACRWAAQVRGVVIDGKRWHSDAEGRAALVESAVLSAEWEAEFPGESWETDWKTADGFVCVKRPQLIAAAFQVAAHIQAVFAREATLSARIAEGDFEQLAALAAEIEGGW